MDNATQLAIGGARAEINSRDVGLIAEDGLTIEGLHPEVHEHMSNRHLDPVRISMTGRDTRINLTLIQWNDDNLTDAIAGLTDDNGTLQLTGVPGQEIPAVELSIIPTDGSRSFTFHKVVPIEVGEIPFHREDKRTLEITFRVIADLTRPDTAELIEQSS